MTLILSPREIPDMIRPEPLTSGHGVEAQPPHRRGSRSPRSDISRHGRQLTGYGAVRSKNEETPVGEPGFRNRTIRVGGTSVIVLPNQHPSLGCGSKSTHRNEKMRAAVECRNGRNESDVAVTRWGSRRWTGSC